MFEYDDEIVLLDAGLSFPTEGMHGVNIVLPDITYLKENQHKIKGMIVTHGHEDHIGGIAFHLQQFNIPVIHGPRLAMALLQGKLEEAGVRIAPSFTPSVRVTLSSLASTSKPSTFATPTRWQIASQWLSKLPWALSFTAATSKLITRLWTASF